MPIKIRGRMDISKRCATIRDVAKLAETSIATVSRVINESDYPVKEAVRMRVLEAVKTLDYKPNIYSKRLKGEPSKEIGIIIPSLTNPFYAQVVSSAEKMCITDTSNVKSVSRI